MPIVNIRGNLEINEEELSDFVRSEIDSSDFGELMGDAVSESLSDWDLDQMQSDIQELDQKFDAHDDRLDDVQRNIEQLMEVTCENKEDWKAVRGESGLDREELREIIGQEIDGFDLSGFKTSPEVDHALKKQHQRIEELEHAMLCIFEHLHSARQQNLGRGHERFNDSLKGGE